MRIGGGPDIDLILERVVTAPHTARTAIRDLVHDHRRDWAPMAELATSEVVSHALTQGTGPCRLRAWHSDETGWLRVEVEQVDTNLPDLVDDHAHRELGELRLAVLLDVPSVWGVDHTPFGQTVWFEIDGSS